MWSLPDLDAINESALTNEQQKREALAGEHNCEWCGKAATHVELYHHPFCEHPVGIVALCDECYDHLEEGYFWCARCGNLHIRNYTWELYVHTTEYGEEVCINCHRETYLGYENHWLNTADALELPADELYKLVKAAPHLFAVGQDPAEHGLEKVGEVLLDSFSGTEVCGFSSSADSPSSAIASFQQAVAEAKEKGAERFVFILDGAYQFCVNIGVYIERGAESEAA